MKFRNETLVYLIRFIAAKFILPLDLNSGWIKYRTGFIAEIISTSSAKSIWKIDGRVPKIKPCGYPAKGSVSSETAPIQISLMM
jgi:hypothetical protein